MRSKITDKLLYRAGEARIPLNGVFELTPLCNFSCKMCYIRKTPEEIVQKGGLQSVEQWMNWAEEAKANGMLYLLLTGGEPLVYPGFWELYEKLSKMGFVISINSNGSMINEENVKRFAKMPPKRINITLYGASQETYENLCGTKNGFIQVLNASRLLKEYGIAYKYNCSLTPYNCHELQKIHELAKEQNVPVEVATYMFPPVRRILEDNAEQARLTAEEAGYYAVENMYLQLTKEQFAAYAARKMQFKNVSELQNISGQFKGKEMGCRAGRCSFWIDWEGNMSACGMINTPCYNLKNDTFIKTWEHIVENTNRILCLSGCAGCPNQGICHACISTAYCETGDIHGRPTYVCKMIGAEAEACKEKLQKINL